MKKFLVVVALVAEATLRFISGNGFAFGADARFNQIYYGGPNMPCVCDSLVGPDWPNASSADCDGSTSIYWMADRMDAVGIGDASNAHAAALLARDPTVRASVYETIADEPATYNGMATSSQWYDFLDDELSDADRNKYYEQSFMHFSEETIICYEKSSICWAVQWPAGAKVPLYLDLPKTGLSTIGSGNYCPTAGSACSGTENLYDGTTYVSNGDIAPFRFAMCFSDSVGGPVGSRARVRDLFTQYIKERVMNVRGDLPESDEWLNGLYLDNANYALQDIWGQSVYSGGNIREAGQDIDWQFAGSFNTWYNYSDDGAGSNRKGRIDFFDSLNVALDDGASWYTGGIPLTLTLNCAAGWGKNGSNWPASAADFYHAELQFSLVAAGEITAPLSWFNDGTDDRPIELATPGKRADNGGFCPNGPPVTNHPLTYSQLVYIHYAYYRAVDDGDDSWGMQYFTSPCNATYINCVNDSIGGKTNILYPNEKKWDQKVWGPVIDKTLDSNQLAYLGAPTGALVEHSNSGGGTPTWRIYRRPFSRGWVWLRASVGSIDSASTWTTLTYSANGGPSVNQHVVKADGTIESTGHSTYNLAAGRAIITINANASGCCPAKACCEEIDP